MQRVRIILLSSVAFSALAAKHPPVPLPYDVRVAFFGCTADKPTTQPGTMPQWVVNVWWQETMTSKRLGDKLSAYDASDPKSLNKALRDCETWMKLVTKKFRSGVILRPLVHEVEKEKQAPPPERPQ